MKRKRPGSWTFPSLVLGNEEELANDCEILWPGPESREKLGSPQSCGDISVHPVCAEE